MKEQWLQWAIKLQSISQAGLAYTENRYDIDRYQQIRDLSIEILHNYTEVSHEKITDLFASETGYQTPKVDIRAAVFKGNKILMVKEKTDCKWSLPGGWADVNSSVSESAERECLEEAGAVVKPKKIIAIHLANRHNNPYFPYTIYKIFVACDLLEFKFEENTETLEAGFFSLTAMPELSSSRNTFKQIEMCFDSNSNKESQTIFD